MMMEALLCNRFWLTPSTPPVSFICLKISTVRTDLAQRAKTLDGLGMTSFTTQPRRIVEQAVQLGVRTFAGAHR